MPKRPITTYVLHHSVSVEFVEGLSAQGESRIQHFAALNSRIRMLLDRKRRELAGEGGR